MASNVSELKDACGNDLLELNKKFQEIYKQALSKDLSNKLLTITPARKTRFITDLQKCLDTGDITKNLTEFYEINSIFINNKEISENNDSPFFRQLYEQYQFEAFKICQKMFEKIAKDSVMDLPSDVIELRSQMKNFTITCGTDEINQNKNFNLLVLGFLEGVLFTEDEDEKKNLRTFFHTFIASTKFPEFSGLCFKLVPSFINEFLNEHKAPGEIMQPVLTLYQGCIPTIDTNVSDLIRTLKSDLNEIKSKSILKNSLYKNLILDRCLDLLGDSSELTKEKYEELTELLRCSIALKTCMNPMLTFHGQTYEESSIQLWLKNHNTDPETRDFLHIKMLSNNDAADKLIDFLAATKKQLVKLSIEDSDVGSIDFPQPGSATGASDGSSVGEIRIPESILGYFRAFF